MAMMMKRMASRRRATVFITLARVMNAQITFDPGGGVRALERMREYRRIHPAKQESKDHGQIEDRAAHFRRLAGRPCERKRKLRSAAFA